MSSQGTLTSVFPLRRKERGEGNLRELWATSFPFMLSALSTALMLFLDRLFLANYSTDALNASVSAGATATIFLLGCIIFTSITEVFVAQFVGAKQFLRVGEIVWQMVWFACLTTFFFWPMAIWGSKWLYDSSPMAVDYFQTLMFFGPITPLIGALSAFFIGQRILRVVTIVIVFGNIANIFLDSILIFGIPGIIPEYGIQGAAFATGSAQLLQVVILSIIFLRKKNRVTFGTLKWKFQPQHFLKTLKIGSPNAIAQILEPFAWALYYSMMMAESKEHITVVGISQSIYVLFAFIVDGVSKGASTLAGNHMGAKNWQAVWKILFSGVKLYIIFFLVAVIFLVVYPNPLINLFLSPSDYTDVMGAGIGSDIENSAHLRSVIRICFFWTLLYIFFDGIRYLLTSFLTASGDTLFLSLSNSILTWLAAILPIYFFITCLKYSIATACMITVIYNAITCAVLYWRFKSEKWKQRTLCDQT